MKSGCHSNSSPRCSNAARNVSSRPPLRTYHCRLVTISSGRSPFSKNLTGCMIARGSPRRSPEVLSISTIATCACFTVFPASSAYRCLPVSLVMPSGASTSIRPSRPMIGRVGNCSSRHQMTSVKSPKVQIIAMPVPLSI